MKLIVGLGNPGSKYSKNHHNAGFIIVDEFARRNNLSFNKEKWNGTYVKVNNPNGENYILAKPFTFMNLSGMFINAISNFYGIAPEDVLVIYDDKDLSMNSYKYKFSGGHGGHNGIRNIIDQFGHKDFSRLRIGIGSPHISSIKDYVLKDFNKDQLNHLLSNNSIYESIDFFLREKILEVMNKYNEKI